MTNPPPDASKSQPSQVKICEPLASAQALHEGLSLDSLFKLLTEEIRDRHETGKLEGWTPWVVAGALVSISSLLLQDLWHAHVHWNSIESAYLVTSITLFGLSHAKGRLGSTSRDLTKISHFFFAHTKSTALSVLAKALWFASISWVSSQLNLKLDLFALHVTSWIFLVLSLTGGLLAILILVKISMPISNPHPLVATLSSFITLGFCFIVIKILWNSADFAEAEVVDIRAGGLLTLGALSLMILSMGRGGQTILLRLA